MVLAADKSLPPEEDSVPDPVMLTAGEARTHKGEAATVCGRVAAVRVAASVPGAPTYLDLDQVYPNQAFSIVIWRADRSNFPQSLEAAYQEKRICATGRIEVSGGAAHIVVRWPNSLRAET
jgi:hypothetical protein